MIYLNWGSSNWQWRTDWRWLDLNDWHLLKLLSMQCFQLEALREWLIVLILIVSLHSRRTIATLHYRFQWNLQERRSSRWIFYHTFQVRIHFQKDIILNYLVSIFSNLSWLLMTRDFLHFHLICPAFIELFASIFNILKLFFILILVLLRIILAILVNSCEYLILLKHFPGFRVFPNFLNIFGNKYRLVMPFIYLQLLLIMHKQHPSL